LLEIWGVGPAGNASDHPAVNPDGIAVAGNASVGHFKSCQLLPGPALLLLDQRVSSDKISFVEPANPAQTSLEQGCFFVEFVAVKRVRRLEAQRVSRSEPRRDQALGFARGQQPVPHLLRFRRRKVKLKAVLSGVAGAREQSFYSAAS